MSVLLDKNTKIIIQGFTGKMGSFHAEGREGRDRHGETQGVVLGIPHVREAEGLHRSALGAVVK